MKKHRSILRLIFDIGFCIFLIAASVAFLPIAAQADNTWAGNGSTTNWSDGNNWTGGAVTSTYFGTLNFDSGGTRGTTSILDVSGVNGNKLLWTGSSPWTLNNTSGFGITLYDNGGVQAKIENQSAGLVTINVPITFAATAGAAWAEINAVSGNMTFGSNATINVSGSAVNELRFYGNNGKTLTLNGTITAVTKKLVLGDSTTPGPNNTVILNAANSYSGNTEINGGTIQAGNSTALGTSAVYIGNGGTSFGNTSGTLAIGASGLTIANSIFTNKADNSGSQGSGNRTISAVYASGTSTLNGTISINGGLVANVSNSGATLAVSSVIQNGSDTGVVLRSLTKTGNGTLSLSGNNTYTGGTTINAGKVVIGIASTFSGGAVTSGAFGNGTVTLADGVTLGGASLVSGANKWVLNGNVAIGFSGQQGRLSLSGAYDLNGTGASNGSSGTVRTMTLFNPYAASVYTGGTNGGNNLDLTAQANGPAITVGNGTLRFAADAGIGAGSYAGVQLGAISFTGATGLTIGSKVITTLTSTFTAGGSVDPRLAVETGGIFQTGSGTSARAMNVYSLMGGGIVTNLSNNATAANTVLTIDGADTADFSGVIANGADYASTFTGISGINGTISVVKSGSGNQTFSGTGNNTYTGNTTVNGGTLVLAKTGGAYAVGGNLTVNSGGTTQLSGSGGNQIVDAAAVAVNSGGVLDLNGQSETVSTLTLNGTGSGGTGVLVNNSPSTSSSLTVSSNTTLAGNVTVGGSGNITLNSGISGAFAITKNGTGAFIIGSFDRTPWTGGGWIVNSGTLGLTNGNNLGANPGAGGIQVTFAGNSTLQFQNNTGSDVASGRGFAIGSSVTTTIDTQGFTVGLANAISGNGSLIKIGSGMLTLNGSNTLNGSLNSGLTINAGTLRLGNAGALNSSAGSENAVSFGASSTGVLQLYGNSVVIKSLDTNATVGTPVVENANASNATLTIGNSANQGGTYAGVLQDGSGAGILSLTKNGTGTLTLLGANSYTGNTTINSGSLQIGNGSTTGSLSTSSAIINNATLSFNRSDTVTQGTHFNNVISGSGVVQQSGSGTLVLNGSNTFTGGAVINLGKLQLGSTGALNSTTGSENAVSFGASSTGALQLNGNSVVIKSLDTNATVGTPIVENANASNATLTIGNSANQGGTYAGVLRDGSGAGILSMTKLGNGTLTLSGSSPNTYTGLTSILAGVLALNKTAGVNAITGNITVGDASGSDQLLLNASNQIADTSIMTMVGTVANTRGDFRLNGFDETIGGLIGDGVVQNMSNGTVSTLTVNVANGASFTANTTIRNSDGTMNGTLSFVKSGNGTQILTGTNSYSGQTTVAAGTLSFNTGNATSTGTQALGINGTLNLGVASTSSGTLNYTGAAGTLAKAINALGNGSDTIQNSGSGLLTLAGTLTKNGTTLTLKGGSQGINVTGAIAGSSANSDLIVDGGNTTLSSANTYNGPTYIINGATLTANATNALPTANGRTAVLMDQSGTGSSTLALTVNQTVASLTGASSSILSLGNRTLTIGTTSNSTNFQGAISGTGGTLIKDSASTQVLSGNNTFTGGVAVNAGNLTIGNAGALNNTAGLENTVTFGASSTGALQLNGYSVGVGNLSTNATVGTPVVENASASNATLTVGNSLNSTGTFAGTLRDGTGVGTLSLLKAGTGTLTISGNNTFSGSTTINGGTLQVGAGGATGDLGSSSSVSINGGTLAINRSGTYNYLGGMTSTGSTSNSSSAGNALTVNGGGTFTLNPSGSNSISLTGNYSTSSVSTPGAIYVGASSTLVLGGSGGSKTASTNTITNSNSGAAWGSSSTATVQVNSGTWNMSEWGGNAPANNFLGTLQLNGGTISFTGMRYMVTPTINVAGGALLMTGVGAIQTNAGRFNLGATTTSGTATMNISSGFVDLAQGNGAASVGSSTASNTETGLINQSGGYFRVGVTTGGGANGGTTKDFTIGGVASTTGTNALTLSGGNMIVAGTLSGTTVGTGGINNFNFLGGTLTAGTITATNFGYSTSATATTNQVANSTNIGTLTNVGGTLAPGGLTLGTSTNSYGDVTVTPTATAGKTSLTGGYTQLSGGTLAINLGSNTIATAFQSGVGFYDTIAMTGALTLGGKLNVSAINSYTPSGTFNIITGATSNTGTFSNVNAVTGRVNLVTTSGALAPGSMIFTRGATSTLTSYSAGHDLIWVGDGSTNAWNTSASNWNAGGTSTTYADPDYVTFDNTGSLSPSIALNSTVSPSAVIFANTSGTYTVAGSGGIGGSGTLTVNGTGGTVMLATANSYTGGTTITAGTVKVGNVTALGGNVGAVSVASGAVLDLNGTTMTGTNALTLNGTGISNGGALTNSNASAGTYAGLLTLGGTSSIIAGTGDITLSNNGTITGSGFGLTVGGAHNTTIAGILATGAGTLTKQDAGTLTLTGANTYTGGTSVNAGVLKVGSATALGGNSSAVTVAGGAALDLNGTTMTNTNALSLNGTGISSGGALANTAAGNATYAGLVSLAGNSSIIASGGNITLSNGGTISGSGFNLTVGGAKNTTISSIIGTGAGSLTKQDAGALTLTGASTFTGGVTLSSGTLNINSAGAAGNGPIGNNGTFTINGGTIDNTSGSSKTVANVNPIAIGGDFAFSTSAGTANNTLNLPGAVSISADRILTLNGAATLTLAGKLTNIADSARTLTVNNGSGTAASSLLTIGSYDLTGSGSTAARNNIINGTGNVTISGVIADGVSTGSGLTYSGSGTLSLGGGQHLFGWIIREQWHNQVYE